MRRTCVQAHRQDFFRGKFADARGTDQAENRSFEILLERDDGEKFEEAIFDFLEPEMRSSRFGGGLDVEGILRVICSRAD